MRTNAMYIYICTYVYVREVYERMRKIMRAVNACQRERVRLFLYWYVFLQRRGGGCSPDEAENMCHPRLGRQNVDSSSLLSGFARLLRGAFSVVRDIRLDTLLPA